MGRVRMRRNTDPPCRMEAVGPVFSEPSLMGGPTPLGQDGLINA